MADLIQRKTRLRWRRRFRRSRQQVEDMGQQAEQQLDQLFFRRLGRLASVRRFVIGWMLLVVLVAGGVIYQLTTLTRSYQTVKAVPGGIYTEGILGSFTDANPLYASGSVDRAVSRLLFAGLLKYDERNVLVGDLASEWSVDERGTVYTVKLRPGLTWHDGEPLTAEDVVFTYRTIQNPDAKSPLYGSWQGVKVAAADPLTVTFTLPGQLVSFPHSLITGVVPKHLLEDVPPLQLRSVRFNTDAPVGAGPFTLENIEVEGDTPETRQEKIALAPYDEYYAGKPKLQRFVIRSFVDEKALLASYSKHELTAISGLETVPDELAKNANVQEYGVPLTSQVGVFFKTTQQPALSDQKVRQALVQAVDQGAILKGLGYPVIASKSPFLASHFAYDKSITQPPFDVNQANALLDQAGWKVGADGIRAKDGQSLTFQLYSQSTSEYTFVSQKLQEYWRAVGVNASVMLQSDLDIQSTVNRGGYDALLYGISLGTDPDVYAYWHSSQASPTSVNHLNFSRYSSKAADKALEAGRTRSDPALRTVKYKPFLEAWKSDVPALMLYQPRYLYLADKALVGLVMTSINDPSDRYTNVHLWMIRQARQAE